MASLDNLKLHYIVRDVTTLDESFQTMDLASSEARRLAKENPGRTFLVYLSGRAFISDQSVSEKGISNI